ncbi:MAG: qxtA [Gammaproteobacteria bacterium]|jgi:cytochrome d ubiquinol oxidase subunit I|nr:qxtA [Gammaproteobacteria bacterium]
MPLTAVLLSRIQFGFTIGFHILFPSFNLGLAWFIVVCEAIWLKTQRGIYLQISQFLAKIFALTFGMGVVSGIVLGYELGTNFAPLIAQVGNILGPLFAYEVLSAFFLEAGFLGIMLFGWQRVNPKIHFIATLLVALGTSISAFWIMSANSWMQTPAGYQIVEGKFSVNDWGQVIFNPSFVWRFLHMEMASWVTTCFVIAGVSAWYLIRNQHEEFAKICFRFSLAAALPIITLQILLGDLVGLKIHEYQPLKTAAMEAVWRTEKSAPFIVFAIPDQTQEKNHYVIKIPYAASLLNTHHLNGELIGLTTVPAADRPLVWPVFFMFRIMLAIGFFYLAVALYAQWLSWRKTLFTQKSFFNLCLIISPLGFVSTLAGWITAETGRQPWVIYGLMRTSKAASTLDARQVILSLILFILAYGLVFSFYLFYLFRLIRLGPKTIGAEEKNHGPFSYLGEKIS